MARKKKKKKKLSVKDLVAKLERAMYADLGESDNDYQEGYSDGLRALARHVRLK